MLDLSTIKAQHGVVPLRDAMVPIFDVETPPLTGKMYSSTLHASR